MTAGAPRVQTRARRRSRPPLAPSERSAGTERRPHRLSGKLRGRSGKSLAVVGGILAALAALTSVIAWVQGEFKSPGIPRVADAQILNPRILSQHDRLIDYLHDTNQSTAGLSRADGEQQGIRATVRVRFQGQLHQRLPLRWTMRRADGTQLHGRLYNQRPIVFTVEHESDARTVPIWAPYPPRAGRYSIDFTVADSQGKPLDEESTPVFVVRRVPQLQ